MPKAELIGGKRGEKRAKKEMVGAIKTCLGIVSPKCPLLSSVLPFLRLQMHSESYSASCWGSISVC